LAQQEAGGIDKKVITDATSNIRKNSGTSFSASRIEAA
jgi:hypothetical protein